MFDHSRIALIQNIREALDQLELGRDLAALLGDLLLGPAVTK